MGGGINEFANIDIEGTIPQYFLASAYLLEKESHEPLCSAYTTQMYTKGMQDFMDMTADDFAEEQVLNLDDDTASNFAVYNDKTVVVAYQEGVNQMTANGGTYTIQNASPEISALQAGSTFSYTDANGEVSIIKVKTIQKSGGTVTITEDADVELEDVFDYVKIEGGYQQDDSGEPRASAIELEDSSHSRTERFDWTKNLGSGSLTATLKASGALTAAPYIKVYLSSTYQYVECTLTMTAEFDCSASGKLARQSVDLLPTGLSFYPVPGVTITFMPRLEFEASGNVSFSAKMVASAGFSCDGKNGLVNKSSGPSLTKCDFHIDATVYLGLGLEPAVHVGIPKTNLELGSLSLNLQVGAQITGKMDVSAVNEDASHLCQSCIAGDIIGKLKVDGTLTLSVIGEKTANLADFSKKLTDFYYSFDYDEFGWTTCPHVISKPIAQGTCGENLQWRLGEDGVLTVSGTGDMTGWSSYNGMPWYSNRTKITSVVLENGVTSVGACAFYDCENLKDAAIPDGVAEIGNHAFQRCKNLSGMVLPESVTYIGNSAFSGCSSMTGVKIPAKVTNIGNAAFGSCISLTEMEIPESVTVIGEEAFYGCTGLLEVSIPAGTMRIGRQAFRDCTYLLRAEIGGETLIGEEAFSGCSSMTTVTLGSEITSIESGVFCNCSSLKSVIIPDSINNIGGSAFYGCTSLASVDLGNGVTSIGSSAFSGCTRLPSIIFSSNINSIGYYAFSGCTSLASIYFTGNAPNIMGSYPFYGIVASVYYPANNDSWANKQSNYGGTLTWVAYDPVSIQSIGPDSAAFIAQPEPQASISETAEPQDDPDISLLENPNAVVVGSEPPTAQAFTPLEVYAANAAAGGQTAQFTGLMPGADYVLLVSKDLNGAGALTPSNLLYIAQGAADSSGSLSFSYIPRTTEAADTGIYGPDYTARDISGCTVTLSQTSYVYDKTAREPDVTVKDGQTTLLEGTDYTLSYKDNTNAGTASVIVAGMGEYAGTKIIDFTIEKADNTITASDITRTASPEVQSFSIGAKADGDAKLSYQSDSESIKVDENGEVTIAKNFTGEVTLTIKAAATANYKKAEKQITLTVKPAGNLSKDIGGCTVTLSQTSYVYNGTARKPGVTVKDGQTTLLEGTGYTLSYKNNTNAGTASVTVAGTGGYTGTKTVNFTIKKADNTITAANISRTAAGKTQSFSIGAKAKGGAKLSYQSGSKSVKVNGNGKVTVAKNFTGKAVLTITAAATANYNKTLKKITLTVKAAKPAKTVLKALMFKNKSPKMTVKWKKTANVTGYQIQYSTSRKFGKGAKKQNVKGAKKISYTIGKLTKGKKYYVRVRTYKKTAGTVTYSAWSNVRQMKIKK